MNEVNDLALDLNNLHHIFNFLSGPSSQNMEIRAEKITKNAEKKIPNKSYIKNSLGFSFQKKVFKNSISFLREW